MKRKSDESAFEFRQRKKKEKYRKMHMYDYDKDYWDKFHKNASKRATEQNRNLIHELFGHNSTVDKLSLFGTGDVNQNPQRERTWSEFGRQAVAGASGAALGFINMNVPGAIIGGTLASRAAAPNLEDVMDVDSTQNILSVMPGTYQGKVSLNNKFSKGLRDKYQKYGAVFIVENYGSVADPDLCYIGHSTFCSEAVTRAIGYALLRKLFRKGLNVDVVTPYEELPLKNVTPDSGPNAFKIVYQTRNAAGTLANHTHTIANDESINNMLVKLEDGFNLYDNINNAILDRSVNNLETVFLYSSDDKLHYRLNMMQEMLKVAMSSHMVIQNRTKSASDGSTLTTAIDAQPLKGPVYEFSSGIPKLKSSNPIAFNESDVSGVFLIRSGQLGGTDVVSYKEPPVKGLFQNVTKSAYARLNPGALKSMTIGTDIKGYFGDCLFKLRFNIDGAKVKRCYGKSQIACFEEELNSGSTNNIVVSYECQHVVGAELVTTLNPNMQPGYNAVPISNLPA